MDQNRFGGWAQLVGNFAIVAGIAIVIFELNQNKQLVYAQLFVQEFSEIDSQFLAMQGEDPRPAFFKAEFCPSELTGEDVVTLSAYYERWVVNWLKMYRTTQIAALDRPWREVVKKDVRTVFSNPLARRWLNVYLAESVPSQSAPTVMPVSIKEIAVQTLAEPPRRRQKELYITLLPENSSSAICGVIEGE